MNLIYKASQYGFESSSFHIKCDKKLNTLVIIKSKNGNLFGGYTEQSWSGSCYWKADSNAFIFSLINKLNEPLLIECFQNYVICCESSYGQTFGGGHDLHIAGRSNTNTNSYLNIDSSHYSSKL